MITNRQPMPFVYNDGGRKSLGLKKAKGDCVCRAISIAACMPYEQVSLQLELEALCERPRGGKSRSNPDRGVHIPTIRRFLSELGWKWTPTMTIGSGCKVHLAVGELPAGRLIVNLSKHLTAVVDGTVHDIYDPSRGGTRCVYGYWTKMELEQAEAT